MRGLMYLLDVILHMAKAYLVMRDHQRKLDEAELKKLLLAQKARLTEVQIEQASNRLVVSDLQIETERLKILELKRKLGLSAEEFKPVNYE